MKGAFGILSSIALIGLITVAVMSGFYVIGIIIGVIIAIPIFLVVLTHYHKPSAEERQEANFEAWEDKFDREQFEETEQEANEALERMKNKKKSAIKKKKRRMRQKNEQNLRKLGIIKNDSERG